MGAEHRSCDCPWSSTSTRTKPRSRAATDLSSPATRRIEARSRALLSDADLAEREFRKAIEHLSRARVRTELARAYLLYGEWLRRELTGPTICSPPWESAVSRSARARGLLATVATVRARAVEAAEQLTEPEALIARLARDGLSNPEIGARLFFSARPVDWHLRKVFTKLEITSRRQLA